MKDEIFERLRRLETKTCPFANLPEPKNARRGEALTAEAMKKYRWIRAELVVQLEFTDWTDAKTCAPYCTSFSIARTCESTTMWPDEMISRIARQNQVCEISDGICLRQLSGNPT